MNFKHLLSMHRREEGQSIILIAGMSLFLLAILAVVIETGAVYIQRRNLQNAADAAALAGAQALNGDASSEAPAIAAAGDYAALNISNTTYFLAEVQNSYTEVHVTVKKKAATAFAGWMSFGEPEVTARAAARIASFNIIRCVVPLAVQDSFYFEATSGYPTNPIDDPPPLVPLKVAVQSDGADSGSNTGLVDLGSGNSAAPISEGSGCNLGPVIDTKPGGTIGDVNNGMEDRLKAARDNNCYDWADVQPPSVTGAAEWRCQPEKTVQDDGIQATAVILVPVLATDIIETGSTGVPLAQLDNGQYLLAYFWVSGDDTYDTSGSNWRCLVNSTTNKCLIWGRFIVAQPVDLSVFDPDQCPGGNLEDCVIDFDPAATTKIVQLID